MSGSERTRRDFLRLATVASLGALTGCRSQRRSALDVPGVPSTGSPTDGATTPAPTARPVAWRRVQGPAPPARREHTLTAVSAGDALLFGGRADGRPLDDLWRFDGSAGTWTKIDGRGPSPRFGHNAVATSDGTLLVFGGQGRGSDFFDDTWAFDAGSGWRRLDPAGTPPARRYGASAAAIGDDLVVSHGFTFSGRFDDTRSLRSAEPRWSNVTPRGARPMKRCLHGAARVDDQMLLFGGQANGMPFLGDTWMLDLAAGRWRRLSIPGPSARNLFAIDGAFGAAFVFGGSGPDGMLDDTWRFDGASWRRIATPNAPPPRGGVAGSVLADGRMLVFGGTDGRRELDDTWELGLAG